MKEIKIWSIMMLMVISLPMMVACGSDDKDLQSPLSEEEQQIVKEVEEVSNEISEFFIQSETAAQMASHLDKITTLEQVKTAWAEDDAVYATLKCGITMFWYFPIEGNSADAYSIKSRSGMSNNGLLSNLVKTRASGDKPVVASNTTVCIINQYVNENAAEQKSINATLSGDAQVFRNWGYKEVREVSGSEFTPWFLKDEIANYDLVIMCTHGMYDGKQHWILTGQKLNKGESFYSTDNIMLGSVKNQDGKFFAVSENWLKMNVGRFSDNSLMFCTACCSLKGNYNIFENALKERNLGCYFGFNGNVYRSFAIEESLDMIMSLMVLGSTAQGAYNLLDDIYKKNNGTSLICLQRENADVSICDYVDLGLSVMWGTRNLGALSPFELGDFYQWGELEAYNNSNKDYVYWTNSDHDGLKYLGSDISGNPEYDPATAILGNPWRMPTRKEVEELRDKCTSMTVKSNEFIGADKWVSTTKGGMLLSSNNSIIFLPYWWNSAGYYWTGTQTTKEESTRDAYSIVNGNYIDNYEAWSFWIPEPTKTGKVENIRVTPHRRMWMTSIRPVYAPQ